MIKVTMTLSCHSNEMTRPLPILLAAVFLWDVFFQNLSREIFPPTATSMFEIYQSVIQDIVGVKFL